MYAERVDAKGQKSPCGDTGVESTVSPTAPGSSSTIGRSVPPESKHIVQARTMPTTSSDRQRTPQACDKCRERKTKANISCDVRNHAQLTVIFGQCSGDHPVCSRCTTRGLICQYSSREPRLRGASKMRLRKASSSVGLRPTQPNNSVPVQQQPQHVQGHSNQPMPELYYFRDFVEDEQSVEHHRSSVAQSNHDFSEFHPNPMTGFSPQEFCEMAVVRYEPSFGGETTARPQRTPRQGFSDHNQHHPQQWWSGVRQVQSHITSEGDASMQFRSHSPTPLLMEGLNSHDSFSIQGSVSPTFQHPLPLSERAAVGQLVHQKALHVDQMYYHSDSDRYGTISLSTTLILNQAGLLLENQCLTPRFRQTMCQSPDHLIMHLDHRELSVSPKRTSPATNHTFSTRLWAMEVSIHLLPCCRVVYSTM